MLFLAQSEIAREVDSAFAWIGGISVALLVGITAAMVYFVLRFRHTRNPDAKQIHGNLKLEVTWIVIPTILVLFMFYKGYEGFRLMRDVPGNAMVVEVQAAQWYWSFHYPDKGITSDKLYVPVNQPVKLELHASEEDVVHSFYLPAFRVKEDCVPGKLDNYLWFQSEKEGTYNIFCAEYCGRDHSSMITELVVLSRPGYDAWLKGQIALKNKPVDIEKALDPSSQEITDCDAPKLYATYCISCHGAEGQGGLVEGAREFTKETGWKRSPKITDIYRTLSEGIEGTRMRAFINLRPWDRFALAHYVIHFNPSGSPKPTEEEVAQLVAEYQIGKEVAPKATIPIEKAMRLIAEEASRKGR